ncbi:hypothetical protein EDD85DRAFT_392099 [Armillaria nabsnona]|nr:hypothetical protein EDD85DRAFT_392099 [Armillaria nabsnona]
MRTVSVFYFVSLFHPGLYSCSVDRHFCAPGLGVCACMKALSARFLWTSSSSCNPRHHSYIPERLSSILDERRRTANSQACEERTSLVNELSLDSNVISRYVYTIPSSTTLEPSSSPHRLTQVSTSHSRPSL